ncbi:RecB family exonuclease [Streptomyces tsukubensis]|uniref:RecB family exonuclease n=1 Tax=Streptomyces tsukubensis TaxID=83656 RepID=UPI00344D9A65
MPDPPQHISHSARENLERCAKSYFLAKIARAPRAQSLWLAGGSAVHEATEHYDLMSAVGNADLFRAPAIFEAFFEAQLAQLREKEPNENKWRRSSAEPIETWRRIGLEFVRSYIDWRERSPWKIWTTPDGEPAIELDVSGFLPGCPVEIKAYLDRVFFDPLFKKLWIVDLKTGKRPPKTPDQFRTYGALLKAKYGTGADYGVAFMNRKGTVDKPHDLSLSDATPEAVGAVYGAAWEQIQSGDFPANGFPSECFICDVSAACAAKGGPLAAQYDPDHPLYTPF